MSRKLGQIMSILVQAYRQVWLSQPKGPSAGPRTHLPLLTHATGRHNVRCAAWIPFGDFWDSAHLPFKRTQVPELLRPR